MRIRNPALPAPARFWTILIRPQWKSWLARGAFILIGFSGVGGLFFLGHLLGFADLANLLIWPGVVLAILSAVYTAFLFAQAEGRDLWQSTLLPAHLYITAPGMVGRSCFNWYCTVLCVER